MLGNVWLLLVIVLEWETIARCFPLFHYVLWSAERLFFFDFVWCILIAWIFFSSSIVLLQEEKNKFACVSQHINIKCSSKKQTKKKQFSMDWRFDTCKIFSYVSFFVCACFHKNHNGCTWRSVEDTGVSVLSAGGSTTWLNLTAFIEVTSVGVDSPDSTSSFILLRVRLRCLPHVFLPLPLQAASLYIQIHADVG